MPSDIEGRPEERPYECAPEILVAAPDAAGGRTLTAAETMRVWVAMQLAPNIEVCSSLLRGEYVSDSALDAGWLEFAMQLRMIALKDAVDFFNVVIEAEQRAA
jgi:hypothetical protein